MSSSTAGGASRETESFSFALVACDYVDGVAECADREDWQQRLEELNQQRRVCRKPAKTEDREVLCFHCEPFFRIRLAF